MKKTLTISAIILLIFCMLPQLIQAATEIITVNSESITSLHTSWKIIKGDDMRYKNPEFDDTDWHTITVPSNLMNVYPGYRGKAWYRIRLQFPQHRHTVYTLKLGKINDVDETYFNGRLIGKTGSIDNIQSHAFDKCRYYTIPSSLIKKNNNVLAVRIRGYLHDSSGLIWDDFFIGPEHLISQKRIIHNSYDAVFITVYLFIFFYFFFFSLFPNHLMKQQRALAQLSLFFALYLFCVGQLKYYFYNNFILFHKLQYVCGISIVIFSIILFRYIYREKITFFDKIMFFFLGGLIAAVIAIPEIADLTIPRYLWHSTVFYIAAIFFYKLYTHRKKRFLLINAGFILFLITCILEILRSYTVLPDFDYLRLGLLTFVITISFFLAEEISQAEVMEKSIRDSLEKELDKKTFMVYERNKIIEQDLEIARKIQSKLLPDIHDYSGPFKLYSYYHPVDTVGGDFYDIHTSNNSLQIIIADVAGHGVPGAMLGMVTKIGYEYTKNQRLEHYEILKELNEIIYKSSVMSFFVTTFLCTVDFNTMTLQYSNAGHIPQILFRREQNTMVNLYARGQALGWIEQSDISSKTIPLQYGDRLYLFTDGITECINNNKELLSEHGFMEILDTMHHLSGENALSAIIEKISAFAQDTPFDDDITLLIIDIVK